MQANWRQFWWPCHWGNTVQCALPGGARSWFHAMPLDAAIGQVPTPHCLSGHHYQWICCKTQNTNKTQLLACDYCTCLPKNQVTFLWPKLDLLLCSLIQQAAQKCETPRFKRKTSATFLAIKRWQWTNIQNIIYLEQSLFKKLARICATSGLAVNTVTPADTVVT